MNIKLYIMIIASALIYNIYYDCDITTYFKNYKKYSKIIVIIIFTFGTLTIMNKSPKMTYDNVKTFKHFVNAMPIDKNSKNFITPFLENNTISTMEYSNIERIKNSGKKATKRSVSETKKKYVASKQNWKCFNCETTLNHTFEIDHVVRLENGGTNEVSNLVAYCRGCHGEKTAMENM